MHINNKQKADVYNLLADQYSFSDSTQVAHYVTLAIKLAKKSNYPEAIANAWYQLGWITMMEGHYIQALKLYERVRKTSKKANYKKGIANAWNGRGMTYWFQGKYSGALKCYQYSLKIKEEINDERGIAASLNNIGKIYQDQNNYLKALRYYQKALKIREKIGYQKGMALSHNRIGQIYQARNNYPKAQKSLQKALRIEKQIKDKNGIADSYLGLGKLALAEKKYEKARQYFEKILALRQQIGQTSISAEASVKLGITWYSQQNYSKAQTYLNKGMQIAQATGTPVIVKDAAKYLTKLYQAIGKPQKALENHILFKQMADSLLNKRNIQQITRMEERLMAQKREDSLLRAQHKYENDFEKQALAQKNIYTTLSLITALILALALLFFYLSKQRNNQKLARKNTRLDTQNKLINLLLNENQHRVGNDFVAVFAKIAAIDKTRMDEESQQLIDQAKERINEAMELQDLLRYPFHAGAQSFDHTAIEAKLHTIAHTLYNMHFEATDQCKVTICNQVDMLDQNRFVMISFCVFELIKNACKHAFHNKAVNYPAIIDIGLHENKQGIILSLRNNGKNLSSALFNEAGEFDFKKQKIAKGMSIIQTITAREGGSFSIHTAGVHPEIQEGSYFVCTFSR